MNIWLCQLHWLAAWATPKDDTECALRLWEVKMSANHYQPYTDSKPQRTGFNCPYCTRDYFGRQSSLKGSYGKTWDCHGWYNCLTGRSWVLRWHYSCDSGHQCVCMTRLVPSVLFFCFFYYESMVTYYFFNNFVRCFIARNEPVSVSNSGSGPTLVVLCLDNEYIVLFSSVTLASSGCGFLLDHAPVCRLIWHCYIVLEFLNCAPVG